MAKFSDRLGITKPPTLAKGEISEHLLTALWNLFHPYLFANPAGDGWVKRVEQLYEFLHWRVNSRSPYASTEEGRIEQYFFAPKEWWETYNFIEEVVRVLADSTRERAIVYAAFNEVLEQEGSPYRFVDERLAAVTDPVEIEAIQAAASIPDQFAGAREHIRLAAECMSRRPNPDYRNSIKESISAVESTLKVLTDHKHSDLSAALTEFRKVHPMHSALVRGLDSLYGYSSNEHGVRHALVDGDAKVQFAEAKFMLVACAAFVSFLVLKAAH